MIERAFGIIQNQELLTAKPNGLIVDAAVEMHRAGISAFPVYDGEKLLGIVTKSDINRAFLEKRSLGRIEDIMTPAEKIVFAYSDQLIETCAELMRNNKITHLLIMKRGKKENGEEPEVEEDKVIGIISSLDIMVYEETKRNEASLRANEMHRT